MKDVTHWDEMTASRKNDFAVDSRDIKLHYLYSNVKADPTIENMDALKDELKYRTEIDQIFAEIFPQHIENLKKNVYPEVTEFDCLRDLIDKFENTCRRLDDYSLKWVKAFVAECEGMKSFPAAREESLHRIEKTCQGNVYFTQ